MLLRNDPFLYNQFHVCNGEMLNPGSRSLSKQKEADPEGRLAHS